MDSSDPYVKSLISFGSSLESALSSNSNTNRRRRKSIGWISVLFIGIIIIWFIIIVLIFGRLEDELLSELPTQQNQNSKGLVVAEVQQTNLQQVPQHSLPKYPIIHRSISSQRHTRPLTDQAILQCHKALWHTVNTTVSVLPNNEHL